MKGERRQLNISHWLWKLVGYWWPLQECFKSGEVKKKKGREGELNRKWRIIQRTDKFVIDGQEKGNKMLGGKHCKL